MLLLQTVMLGMGCLIATEPDHDPTSSPMTSADPAQQIDADMEGSIDSHGTQLCVTGSTVYVLWLDHRANPAGEASDIWLNRSLERGAPGSWLVEPVKVNRGPGPVWNPHAVCNEAGVFVVWEDGRHGATDSRQIYFNRSMDQGEQFLDDDVRVDLGEDRPAQAWIPRASVVGLDVTVTWYDPRNGAFDVFASHSQDGGEHWNGPVRIDADIPAGSANSVRPQVAMGPAGERVWIAWTDARDGSASVYFSHSSSGGTLYRPDVRLDIGDGNSGHNTSEMQLCTRGHYVYVVWRDGRNGSLAQDIYFNYSADGGRTWLAEARRLNTNPVGSLDHQTPQCTVQGVSTAHVAWTAQDVEGAVDVYYRRIVGGRSEAEPERLVAVGEGASPVLHTPLIGGDDDHVAVAFIDRRRAVDAVDRASDLYLHHVGPNGTVSDASSEIRIEGRWQEPGEISDPAFVVHDGWWFAAWTDGSGASTDILFHRGPLAP